LSYTQFVKTREFAADSKIHGEFVAHWLDRLYC